MRAFVMTATVTVRGRTRGTDGRCLLVTHQRWLSSPWRNMARLYLMLHGYVIAASALYRAAFDQPARLTLQDLMSASWLRPAYHQRTPDPSSIGRLFRDAQVSERKNIGGKQEDEFNFKTAQRCGRQCKGVRRPRVSTSVEFHTQLFARVGLYVS